MQNDNFFLALSDFVYSILQHRRWICLDTGKFKQVAPHVLQYIVQIDQFDFLKAWNVFLSRNLCRISWRYYET